MSPLTSIRSKALKRPKALARSWFTKAATPLRAELHVLVARLTAHLHGIEAEGRQTRAEVSALKDSIEAQRTVIADLQAQLAEQQARLASLAAVSDDHERQLAVRTMNDWVRHLDVRTAPLISVIMPTRDRAPLLPRAIASMLAQSYGNWELLVVDDGSTDDTRAVLAGVEDARIRMFEDTGRGCCSARNVALKQARGSIIAYLDDDNVMHPDWLKAVVWAFENRPETDVLYGAFIVDDTARIPVNGKGGELPRLYWHRYDHHAVTTGNVADIGAIAHRAGLAEARFDDSLIEMGDWDLLLRLTRDTAPLVLPAIACFYTTDAPHRLSGGPTCESDYAAVSTKNRRSP